MAWTWRATTLNPYYEDAVAATVGDDRLICYTNEEHWLYGDDNSGDLFKLSYGYLKNVVMPICDGFDLVTADGSFSCMVSLSIFDLSI